MPLLTRYPSDAGGLEGGFPIFSLSSVLAFLVPLEFTGPSRGHDSGITPVGSHWLIYFSQPCRCN